MTKSAGTTVANPAVVATTAPGLGAADDLLDELRRETDAALSRVYLADQATACESVSLPDGRDLWLKREDTSRVHSYKWRGAFNKLAWLVQHRSPGSVVAASAGNHAQGVAWAARTLEIPAVIFMPRTTPLLKQQAVKRLGGQWVEVRLSGDRYDHAAAAAREYLKQGDGQYLHPFDDLQVIAGQATMAWEIPQSAEPDLVLLEIGGGGMAAGVASVVRQRFPREKVVGVEVLGQNSMQQSLQAGRPITLPQVTRFCDGTAVATPGQLTFQLCQQLLDDVWLVDERQVCTAIEWLWNERRIVVEPSAGIGVAAALATSTTETWGDSSLATAYAALGLDASAQLLTVLSGANVDFLTFPVIARKGRLSPKQRRYYCFEIPERSGTLIGLLDQFLSDINIIDFQYGKTDAKRAFPVIGVEAFPAELDQLESKLARTPLHYQAVTQATAVEYRVVPFQPSLAQLPVFATVEFPDRPGALSEFMRQIVGLTNVCYFNYTETGQNIEQALMGFEFTDETQRQSFLTRVVELGVGFQALPSDTIAGLGATDSTTR
jgi:threonine dehydratase